MPKPHIYVTIGFKGIKSSVIIDLPLTGVMNLTVAEAQAYANGLPHDGNPVNDQLREHIANAIKSIRNAGGEE